MNDKFKDYYKLLGVTPRASFENIRSAAEHELSQNWNNAMGRLEIQEAYGILFDPEKRKEYDEEFNRRLNEREMAIRNARTFEEYIAATSLHSELANVDVAPEAEIPQEEIEQSVVNNQNTEDVSNTSELPEEQEKEESTVDSSVGSDVSESSSEDSDTSENNEEELPEEQEQEELEEQEKEENLEEEKEETLEEEKEENLEEEQEETLEEEQELMQDVQELAQPNQEFINIPIQRLEKEIEKEQAKETMKGIKEESNDEPIISKTAARELIRAALIAGGVGLGALVIGGVPGVVLGLMAGVASGDFFKKHADKFKIERNPSFQKESKQIEVTEINTEETRILNKYAEDLENDIYDLLEKPSKNYELEIAIRKYENLIALTEKRKDFKEKEKSNSILKKLEIKAFKDKLTRLQKTLKLLKEKKEQQITKKDPRLSRLNQKLSDISYQISAIENDQIEEKMTDTQKELGVEKERLLQKRDAKANKLYVNKDLISFGQVALVKLNSTVNIVKSKVNKFIDLNEQEQIEEVAQPKSL